MVTLPEFRKLNWQFLVVAVFLILTIVYRWNHNYMKGLEYHVASAITVKKSLLDEQKKLRIEVAELKKPERIFLVAITKLQMTYPKQEQIIQLKESHPDGCILNKSWLERHSAIF